MAAAARQLVAERQTLAAPGAAVREREAARLVLLATKTRRRRGGQNERRGREKVAEWAQTLGWPLIGDVLSQTGQPLPCADLWLGNGKAVSELAQAQIVVQLGSSLTGKRVLQWQATCEPDEYWLVDNLPGRLDPAQHRGRRLLSSVERWLELHPAEKRQPWATVIPQLAGQAWQAAVASNEPFGEAQLAQRIRRYLPEQGQLFVGNSPVVRLIDALAQLPAGYPVYSNRGASGIDGLIATAAGVQRASADRRWPSLAISPRSTISTRWPCFAGVGAAGADRGE